MKILMLILASDGGNNNLYNKLQNIKRKYIHDNPNVEAYFYKADPNISEDFVISGDTVYLKTNENYPYLWKKFWLVLKAFENRLHEFDYISRPNLSTFIVMDRYLNYLETLPREKCCSGIEFYGGQPIPFPSGYLFTITPDLAKEFIYNDVIVDNEGIDDRCVGLILNKLNIKILKHHNYLELNNTYTELDNSINRLTNEPNIFMIRIRNLYHYGGADFPFGVDSCERLNTDLRAHFSFLKMIYNIEIDETAI